MNQFTASLWGDEAWAATLAIKPVWQIVTIVSRDTSPPLYYLLLHFWMKIFGHGEVSIRLLSFLFFCATCFFVYLLGKHLWDKKTAMIAAILAFLNPFLFQYAFEGRMYSLLLLTTTSSMYFYLKGKKTAYILSSIASLYTHHFSLFVIFVQFLWSLRQLKNQSLFSALKPYFLIGLAYLPWLYPLYYQTSLVSSGFWLGKPTLKNIRELFSDFFLGQNDHRLRLALSLAVIFTFLFRSFKQWKEEIFLFLWALLPILLTFFISQFKSSIFYNRYLLYCLPPLILILSSRRQNLSLTFILLMIFSLGIMDGYYFTHPTKRPFRELSSYVKSLEQEHPDLFLVNYNGKAHHLFESKYYGLKAPIFLPQGSLPFYAGTALMEKDDIIKTLPGEKEIGVISSEEVAKEYFPGYALEKEVKFDSLYFLWLKKEKAISPRG